MIDALIAGKLIKTPELRTGKTGNNYAQFLLAVATGDEHPTIVSGIAFSDTAERIAKLQKGDPLAVIGSLKPTEWIDTEQVGEHVMTHKRATNRNGRFSPLMIGRLGFKI